jgi:hypothetical protein
LFVSMVVLGLFFGVLDNVSLFFIDCLFFGYFVLVGIADASLSLPDLSADAWQLHDGHVSGLLGRARAALNLRSASTKVSSDNFTSALCGYLCSNCSFVKDIKQYRRRKSVSDAAFEAARKDKNCLKKVARRRDSTPRDGGLFTRQSGPIVD